jgi:hypothetical protein
VAKILILKLSISFFTRPNNQQKILIFIVSKKLCQGKNAARSIEIFERSAVAINKHWRVSLSHSGSLCLGKRHNKAVIRRAKASTSQVLFLTARGDKA